MKHEHKIDVFVLDTSRGKPAHGLPVSLLGFVESGEWEPIAEGITDEDGCIDDFFSNNAVVYSRYRLIYETAVYFERLGVSPLFPRVLAEFTLCNDEGSYVLPLLISPYTYTFYRGS